MRETLYVKYNRTRKKEFQTKVEILIEDDRKYVLKTAIKHEAQQHVDNMLNTYEKYSDYYNRISLVSSFPMMNGVACDFVNGQSISSLIKGRTDSVKETIKLINNYFELITDINDKYKKDFIITDEFREIFPNIDGLDDYAGPACDISNVDPIFDNFIIKDDIVTAIDYEWFIAVCLPIDFIKYRVVRNYYYNNLETCSSEYECRSFAIACGVDEAYVDVFDAMEYDFQQYVHGIDLSNMYIKNYETTIITDVREHIRSKDRIIEETNNHVHNLESQIKADNNQMHIMQVQLNKYSRALHNPAYGLYCLLKKMCPVKIKKVLKIYRNSFRAFIRNDKNYAKRNMTYDQWIRRVEAERASEINKIELVNTPKISVLVPVYNVKAKLLRSCIDSVINQSYDNWELCLVDDCSTLPETLETLKKYEKKNKIKIEYRTENGHISRATNQALNMATGQYIALLDCDDLLTKNALLEVAIAINNNPNAEFLYSDEDKIDETGRELFNPFFKPDWSPDTLMTCMYTCHLGVFKSEVIKGLGGFRVGLEGSQDYDLVLRVMEVVDFKNIIHIPHIIYHWRTRKESTASNIRAKDYIFESTKKAKYEALERRKLNGELEYIDDVYQYRVRYIPSGESKVSIIIPSKDNPEIIDRCISSIRSKTIYNNYEIIVVDNGSNQDNKRTYSRLCITYDCKYIYEPMEFNFSRMCNLGSKNANGDYLLFLNDDMEIINGEWLDRMLGQAELSYAGAVGAKLYYPNSTIIQHTGVINIPAGPSHALCRMDDSISYYVGTNRFDNNFLAVTAACLMVNKKKFEEIGGFAEELKVAYNDVDLCFKLVEAGYYNVVRNDVVLYHYESFSRGSDAVDEAKKKRLIEERNKLYGRHKQFSMGEHMDPFYNHNLIQTNINYAFNIMDFNKDTIFPYRTINLKEYVESDKLVCGVDINVVSEDHFYIAGYAYIKGNNKSDKLKTYIVLYNDDKAYAFEANKEPRLDIVTDNNKKWNLFGYSILSKAEGFDPRRFRLAIVMGNCINYI